MFEPTVLKIIGTALGLLGSAILAARITKILSELSMAVQMHDLNFQVQAARAEGRRDIPNIQMVGSGANVEAADKAGVKLLVLGFLLQIAGGICNVMALLL